MKSKNEPNSRRMRPGNQALGREGEARAARFLERRGYRIVDRNVRAGGVELDLVAQRGRLVIFVEVKTRRSTRYGAPELAVDAAKQRRIRKGASAWLADHADRRMRIDRVRFDVISCLAPSVSDNAFGSNSEPPREAGPPRARGPAAWCLEHLEGAFE